ncbi:aconitase family protein, partial [Corynebacterium heidelbergense]
MSESTNSFDAKGTLQVGEKSYDIYRLSTVPGMEKLPYSLKVLGENLLRNEDGKNVTRDHIEAIANWDPTAEPSIEIQFTPARVIMQDFTGVACIVDLATIRDAVVSLGGRADQVNPLNPAEMVIDHSVIIEAFGDSDAFDKNVEIEYQRNDERYKFLRWGTGAFNNFRVVPPGTGIVHQVNIEYLARSVFEKDGVAYPDTCVGTDSHTTMENGLGILGWGVGGIEAEAAMLGQPISMLIPRVVGFKLTGEINPGVTATDVVLTITDMLRQHGVVGKFVEFYGAGVGELPLANRATIGNMSPEFGSTAAIFPIDEETVKYLELTGRDQETLDRVEAYAKEQGMWLDPSKEVEYSEYLELDLSTVVPSIAGPKRPQDRIELTDSKSQFRKDLHNYVSGDTGATSTGSFDAEGPTTETTSEQQ